MIDNKAIGKLIAKLRQSRGMTQQQLAAVLNVSHQAVSKWENGAALPDIETLMALSRLFGLSVEQILNAEVRQTASVRQEKKEGQNISTFVSGLFDDIGNIFRSEPGETEKKPEREEVRRNVDVDIPKLIEMLPYMSRGAIEDILERGSRKLTEEELIAVAPYISGVFLEKLIRESEIEMTWEFLHAVAPFLRKSTVDEFTKAVVMGEKQPQAEPEKPTTVEKVISIGNNVKEFIVNAVNEARNDDGQEMFDRLAKIRKSAFERAMDDGRWEWIAAHIDEITDEAFKREISQRANDLGMKDWVSRNLGGFADEETIQEAIDASNWGWLGENVRKFADEMQQTVALAAMKAENWQWLSGFAEQIHIKPCVVEIAKTARKAGARMLAVQLAKYDMSPEQAEEVAMDAVDVGDYDFVEMIAATLPEGALCRVCIRLAKNDKWNDVKLFAERLNAKELEWLMQIAIDRGNFDAIDMIGEYLHIS